MSLHLYHHPRSTCAQKVRLVLAEKGCDWTGHTINLDAFEQLSDWYLKLNPNGVVPTLVDGEAVIVDSSVICEYLEETREGTRLSPERAADRAHMRAWMRYFEEVPTVAIRAPSFNTVFVKVFPKVSETEFEARTAKMPLRKHFHRAMGQTGFPPSVVQESLDRLRSTLERVEAAIAGGGPFLMGDFTLADVLLIPSVVRMEDLGLYTLWADLPAFQRWYSAVRQRPSFAAAFHEGARLPVPPPSKETDG